jgi:hypothetical protein
MHECIDEAASPPRQYREMTVSAIGDLTRRDTA